MVKWTWGGGGQQCGVEKKDRSVVLEKVLRLDLKNTREGVCWRGWWRLFHVKGLKMEKVQEPTEMSGTRNLEAESIRSSVESTRRCVKLTTVWVTERTPCCVCDTVIAECVYLVVNSLWDWEPVQGRSQRSCWKSVKTRHSIHQDRVNPVKPTENLLANSIVFTSVYQLKEELRCTSVMFCFWKRTNVCVHACVCVCLCKLYVNTQKSSTGHKWCLSHIQIGGGEKWLLWSGWKCVQLHAACAGQPALHGWGG